MKQFLWIPGEGVDRLALARLRSHFERPSEPMGEAWFMGTERRMFDELLGDLDALSTPELQKPLGEIATGTGSFGPYKEWNSWYHYLLGQALPRSHESYVSYLLETFVTSFVALYPNGVYREPYKGFREDALLTLGRCMMDGQCWNGSDIAVGELLHKSNNNPAQIWRWWDSSGDFAASMFFCLKYLPEELLEPWLESVLAIPSPHWRAQVMVWMVGAHDILNAKIGWPSQFSDLARPAVSWDWSHCLSPKLATTDDSGALPTDHLIPASSRSRALKVFGAYFVEDVFLEWLTCISTVPYLEAEMAEIPTTFEQLYVRAGPV